MKYTTNKSVPKWAKIWLADACNEAEIFLRAKYPHIAFNAAQITFSTTRNRSMYYSSDGSVSVMIRPKLHLYNKATCTHSAPAGGLLVGDRIQTVCAIIHELTHFVQGTEKRKFSEVETTQNEIDYLKQCHSNWFSKLIPN